MNTVNQNVQERPHSAQRQALLKRVSLGFMTMATILFFLFVRPDMTSANDCKTTTGDCSGSIGLYIG